MRALTFLKIRDGDYVRCVRSKSMLKSLQLLCESRGAVASLVAIVLASAILTALVAPIPADGFDHITFHCRCSSSVSLSHCKSPLTGFR
jgi:hypothetical protein